MALSNELEELLSGYLDNQLDAVELRKVTAALQDPAVRARYEELCRMSDDLKALAASPQRSLPSDFAQRVLAAATAQSAAQTPAVTLPNSAATLTGSSKDRGQTIKWAAAVAGLAATITLAVWIPQSINRKTNPLVDVAELNPPDNSPGTTGPDESSEPAPPVQFVRRDDLFIQYIMTLDLELSENTSMARSLTPLLQQHGIELVKGAKVEGDVKEALEKIRVTVPPEDAPLPSEVYLLRAPLQPLDTMLETMRKDLVTYPVFRFGLAFELPSDPLLDKLSLDAPSGEPKPTLQTINGPIVLSQSMADAISNHVDAADSFVAPLFAGGQEELRASPFESIPPQGKLVGSAKRMTKSPLALSSTDEGKFAFLLLFVRQR